MESPFYEKAGRYLHAGISENMTFPVHLQEEMEIIYCLEGSLQATVMNQVREVGEGEFAGGGWRGPERSQNCRMGWVGLGGS